MLDLDSIHLSAPLKEAFKPPNTTPDDDVFADLLRRLQQQASRAQQTCDRALSL